MTAQPPNKKSVFTQRGRDASFCPRQKGPESVICGEGVNAIIDDRGGRSRHRQGARNLDSRLTPPFPIHRQEVWEAIQRENARAAGMNPDTAVDLSKFPNRRQTRPGYERGEPADTH